jgi:flagellar hook assembly protein FlgD
LSRARKTLSLTLTALLLVISAGVPAAGASLFINYPSISPNGDGVKDFMTITVSLTESADTLLMTIEDRFTPAEYDTLLFEVTAIAGDYSATWDGTDFQSILLPEGEYDLHLRETTGSASDDIFRIVVIDTTASVLTIDRIEPGVYAPGWPDTSARVTVYFTVTGWQAGSSGRMTVTNPEEDSEIVPLEVTGDGEWSVWWRSSWTTSGTHSIGLSIEDEAGNSCSDSGSVYIDADDPEITYVTEISTNTREVPYEIVGKCHDWSGITSVELGWTGLDLIESDTFAPDSTWLAGDTLYFRFDTPDTINGIISWNEGAYRLTVYAVDAFGHEGSGQIGFNLDRTPPAPPVIHAPPSRVIEEELELDISLDDDADSLFVYSSDGSDTTTTEFIVALLSPSDPPSILLAEGMNEIWSDAKDKVGNRSNVSNTVQVTFDRTTGITIPEVFRGPDRFQIVSARTASSVELDIYDMRGERVRRMVVHGPSERFEIEWDLKNGDGDEVRNGPYVVVITINVPGDRIVEKQFVAVVR